MTNTLFLLFVGLFAIVAVGQYYICSKSKKEIAWFVPSAFFIPSIFFGVISILFLILTTLSTDWNGAFYLIAYLISTGMLISTCASLAVFIFSKKTKDKANKKTKRFAKTLFASTGLLIVISMILYCKEIYVIIF